MPTVTPNNNFSSVPNKLNKDRGSEKISFTEIQRQEKVAIVSLSASHFVNDAYSNFLGPMLPLLVIKLGLTITQAGWLGAILAVSTSFTQPFYGYLSDRFVKRFFVIFSPLITAVFMSFIGLAPNFFVLSILLALAGIGIASFHPQAAALISCASGDRRGLGMSIFVSSGTFGFALGPLFVTYSVALLGLEQSYFMMIPGVIAFLVLYSQIPNAKNPKIPSSTQISLKESILPIWRPLIVLYFLVVIRSAVQVSFVSFLPLYFTQKGHTLIEGGQMAALFMFFGALGGLLGGPLSDRWGGKKVIIVSMIVATPTLAVFLLTKGLIAAVCLSLGGAFLLCTLPVNVVMAQQLLPHHASMVSALMMGFAWGLGGMAVPVVGTLGDQMGLGRALFLVVLLPIFGFILSFFLPTGERVYKKV